MCVGPQLRPHDDQRRDRGPLQHPSLRSVVRSQGETEEKVVFCAGRSWPVDRYGIGRWGLRCHGSNCTIPNGARLPR